MSTPFVVTVCFLALLALLFLVDLTSSFTRRHRDFRSIIVSVGVLGTFVGVFIGLQGFESADIRGSVPRLLEGMKIAFLTSVVGMGLSVLLSILQKFRSVNADDDVDALNQISSKLDMLEDLQKVENSLNLVRSDIQESQNRIDHNFAETNQTIANALDSMSRNASEEIVRSLERVINDFNNNLTEQFGDNFKQLNAGVAKMLDWQDNYRDTISSSTQLLDKLTQSLQNSETTLAAVAARNGETLQVYENLSAIIQTQKQQTETLKAQMTEYSDLGIKAAAAFSTMQSGFGNIQSGMEAQSNAVAELTQEISKQLPESLRELENTLSGLTNKFARDYQSFLERYRQLLVDEE